MKPIVLYPLPEFAIGEFFPVDVVQAGIPVRRSRRLSYFDREGGQSEAFGNKDSAKSCQCFFDAHISKRFESGPSDGGN
jgi:hypothetical protein